MSEKKTGASALDGYPAVLTTEQVCEALQINRKTCYKMFRNGTFPAVKSGRSYRVSKENVIAYLNGRE